MKDSSGALAPGVKITIKDLNTGVEIKTVTNNTGNYLAGRPIW